MGFPVLVKTTAGMLGSYSYDLPGREEARRFVERPDVWWYVFPLDEDDMTGASWRKGGAWGPLADMAREETSDPLPVHELPARGPSPDLAVYDEAARFSASDSLVPGAADPDDEDDDRW
jgi:hypothetical protein